MMLFLFPLWEACIGATQLPELLSRERMKVPPFIINDTNCDCEMALSPVTVMPVNGRVNGGAYMKRVYAIIIGYYLLCGLGILSGIAWMVFASLLDSETGWELILIGTCITFVGMFLFGIAARIYKRIAIRYVKDRHLLEGY